MVTEKAAVMALVQALSPLLIALAAVPLLGERLSRRQWLGLALGAAGVVLVVACQDSHAEIRTRILRTHRGENLAMRRIRLIISAERAENVHP